MDLRAATPLDAAALAELIYIADLAHYTTSGYELSIGGTRQHQIEELAKLVRAHAPSGFHYSHFDVGVTADGSVAACVAGFERATADEHIRDALTEIGWDSTAIESMSDQLAPLVARLPEAEPGDWTIEHVATLPLFRGLGLAGRLLERAIERGTAHGAQRVVVDVFASNRVAKRVYERAGFVFERSFAAEPMRQILNRDPLERLVLARLDG